jgi:tetratricopeptide (TPR) repeat protein
LHLGQTQLASQLLADLDRDAQGLRHPGLEADVLRLHAAVDRAEHRPTAAELGLHGAARRASREQLDHALARTWLDLAELLVDPSADGSRSVRADEAGRWAAYAETLVERLPEERTLRVRLALVRGDVAAASDKPADALGHYHDALQLLERRNAPVLDRADVLDRLALLVAGRGEHPAAEDYATRAVDIVRNGLGPHHPALAHAIIRLADIQALQNRLEDANSNWSRALTILARAHGPRSREVARALVAVAGQLRKQGQYSAALDHDRRAIAALDATATRDSELLARALVGQGRSMLALGRPADAREPLDRAVSLLESAHRTAADGDPDRRKALGLSWAEAQAELARVLWADAGDRERARTLARGARSLHLEHGGDRSAVADLELVLSTPEPP